MVKSILKIIWHVHVYVGLSQLFLLHESAHDNQLLVLNVQLSRYCRLNYLLGVVLMEVHIRVSCCVVNESLRGVELVTAQR